MKARSPDDSRGNRRRTSIDIEGCGLGYKLKTSVSITLVFRLHPTARRPTL